MVVFLKSGAQGAGRRLGAVFKHNAADSAEILLSTSMHSDKLI